VPKTFILFDIKRLKVGMLHWLKWITRSYFIWFITNWLFSEL